MNTLFNNISWLRYAEWLSAAVIIYYAAVAFRCYRAEITNLFRRGSFKPPFKDQTNPFLTIAADEQPIPEIKSAHSSNLQIEDTGADSLEADTLISALRAQIANHSKRPYQPSAVAPELKNIILKYRNLRNSSHRTAINQLVVTECEKNGIAQLSEQEVDKWWGD